MCCRSLTRLSDGVGTLDLTGHGSRAAGCGRRRRPINSWSVGPDSRERSAATGTGLCSPRPRQRRAADAHVLPRRDRLPPNRNSNRNPDDSSRRRDRPALARQKRTATTRMTSYPDRWVAAGTASLTETTRLRVEAAQVSRNPRASRRDDRRNTEIARSLPTPRTGIGITVSTLTCHHPVAIWHDAATTTSGRTSSFDGGCRECQEVMTVSPSPACPRWRV